LIFVISRYDDAGNILHQFDMWQYSVATDSWTQLNNISVPTGWTQEEGSVFSVVTTPVSKYGVIMFMSAAGTNSKVYLYKHAPGAGTLYVPDITAPVITAVTPTSIGSTGATI